MFKKVDRKWTEWQKKVIYEEYVAPDLDEEKLKKKIEEVNKKYNGFHANMNQNAKLRKTI
ncbi:hypothetical protein [Halalkalibacter alkaliphilus]|uniref:Uncharacterized protein n=1 Tax=Halalkalibacter alkaliphilus TaxID=2917993 RepID=A0A9X2I7Y3_9BACI|nr:hypothetical protein [Halalkalibacter alkaliphilus]MCL7749438.1 hypothetical protein [Halalkalibacter alkaliphilus]